MYVSDIPLLLSKIYSAILECLIWCLTQNICYAGLVKPIFILEKVKAFLFISTHSSLKIYNSIHIKKMAQLYNVTEHQYKRRNLPRLGKHNRLLSVQIRTDREVRNGYGFLEIDICMRVGRRSR